MAARAYRTRSYSGDNSRRVLPAFRSNVAPMRPSLPMTKISADPPCFSAPLWRPYSEVSTPNEKSGFGKATGYPAACALALLEQLFLYLGDTKPPGFFYTDMGHCRNFIGVDHSVENRWSGRCQERANRLCQLRRMTNGETLRSACACEGGEVHIGEAGARCGRHPRTLHFELHEAPARVVVDDNLDWQCVLDARHELAEQHREAAVAGL